MKQLLLAICICSLALTGCTSKEKTTVLEENVLTEDMKYNDKIRKETIEITVEEGYFFDPGYIYEDKIFGLYKSIDNINDVYKAYYSKKDGLIKLSKGDVFTNNENNRMYIGWDGTFSTPSVHIMRDNATNETMILPEIQITEKENRVNSIPSISKDKVGNINVEFLMNKDEQSGKSENSALVIGNDNLGYTAISREFYNKEPSEFVFIGDKITQPNLKSSETILVFHDFKNKKSITYDGMSNIQCPSIRKILYNPQNGKLYAIAGQLENEIYEIEINDNTYSIKFFYKFDLGNRLTKVSQAGIYNNKLLIESYIWDESKKDNVVMKDINKIMLDLNTKVTQVFDADTDEIRNELAWSNSTKFIIYAKVSNKNYKAKSFISRVTDNTMEFIYELDKYPLRVIMDDKEKRMLCYYGNNTLDIYYIDID